MRIYLDTCCFCRPFDLPDGDRVSLEAEAVLLILARIESTDWELVVSDAVLYELRRISVVRRREAALAMAGLAVSHLAVSQKVLEEAARLQALGFGEFDAAHVAFANLSNVDAFLTVDDRLLQKARSLGTNIQIIVANPVFWLASVVNGEPK